MGDCRHRRGDFRPIRRKKRILEESVQSDARQRSKSILALRCAPTGPFAGPLRPTILLVRDRSEHREITVPDTFVATAEQRWDAWQQRGVARDVLNRRRLLILTAFAALALASMLTGIALGGA